MAWEPDRYLKFEDERFAPFEDLWKLVRVREGLKVVDLGCGTGALTARLSERLPGSDVVGVDSSSEMLEKASSLARPGLRFERRTIEGLSGRWDLLFSNAAIHWVEDHPALARKLLSHVAPGGQMVLQFPSNHHHPAHRLVMELASEEPFRTRLGGWVRRSPVLPIEAYAEILNRCGARGFTLFEKVYPHLLPDADAMAEWLSGTTLVPYFERMDAPLRAAFMEALLERLRARWPERPVFYGFKRILLAADAPAGEP